MIIETDPYARLDEGPDSPPDAVGEVKVIVHAMQPGQMTVEIDWPDDATGDQPARHNEFIRLVRAELNFAIE